MAILIKFVLGARKAHARAIQRKKIELAKKLAAGEPVSAEEQAAVHTVVSLNPSDLGEILWGQLDENGFGHPDSPIVKCFTKEKILAAVEKVRFCVQIFVLSAF